MFDFPMNSFFSKKKKKKLALFCCFGSPFSLALLDRLVCARCAFTSHLCLVQGLSSCPKNERGNRVILQMAGPERDTVADWYIQQVAGDYACRVESVGGITRSGCRIAFLELQEDHHAADILQKLRKMKRPCLVVISTDDLTALDVDSFWIPTALKSARKVPVKEWIVDGCKKYSLFKYRFPFAETSMTERTSP